MASLLPEMKEGEISPREISLEHLGAKTAPFPEWEAVARMIERLNAGLTGKEAQELDKLLQSFEPPPFGGNVEELREKLKPFITRIAQFYFTHRNKFPSDLETGGTDLKEVERKLDLEAKNFWELQIFPNEAVKDNKEQDQKFVSSFHDQPFSLLKVGRPQDREPETLESFYKPGEIEEITQALEQGRDVAFPDRPQAIPANSNVKILPGDTFSLVYRHLAALNPDSTYRMIGIFNLGSTHPPHEDPSRKELSRQAMRAASWVMLGVDPVRVMERWSKEILEFYKKERPRLLANLDFSEWVAKLPEILSIPSKKVESVRQFYQTEAPQLKISPTEENFVMFRIIVLLLHHGIKLSDIDPQLDILKTYWDLKTNNKNISRFYLEHRAEVLPHLKPWDEGMVSTKDLTPILKPEASRTNMEPAPHTEAPVDILSHVLALPEIQETPLSGHFREDHSKLVWFLSLRRLPPTLQQRTFSTWLKARGENGTYPDQFLKGLADFYWNNRNEILSAPLLEIPEGNDQALDLHTISPEQRKRVEREMPELDLWPDESMIEQVKKDLAQDRANAPHPEILFWSAASYEAVKLMYFFGKGIGYRDISDLELLRKDLLPVLYHGTFLVEMGASLPHVQAQTSARAMEVYKLHRPTVLAFC
jgi:hypothetical protein